MLNVLIAVVLIIVVIGSALVVDKNVISYLKSTRDLDRVRHDRVLANTENLARATLSHTQQLLKTQNELDDKMYALSRFVDNRTTYVSFQQELFNSQAKAEMLSARREELRRTKELKDALERLMGVALTSRQPAAPNDILALENVTKRIEELEKIVPDS